MQYTLQLELVNGSVKRIPEGYGHMNGFASFAVRCSLNSYNSHAALFQIVESYVFSLKFVASRTLCALAK